MFPKGQETSLLHVFAIVAKSLRLNLLKNDIITSYVLKDFFFLKKSSPQTLILIKI